MRRVTTSSRSVRLLLIAGIATCLLQAQIPDHTAKVIVQYGQVSSLSDNGQRPLFLNDLVKPQQMIVAGPDGYARFEVADGSTFEVFANSKVLFREHIGNFSDLLDVLIGHVKVYIQHLNGLPNYNKVSSPTAVISVRGTVFEVVVEDDEGTTFVSVDEGIVGVRNMTAPGDSVDLKSGDSIRVIKNQPLQPKAVDRGPIFRGILKAAEDAVYQIVFNPSTGGARMPGGVGSPVPVTGNGDKGKGGTTTPTAPGAPTTTTTTTPTAPGGPGGLN